MKEIINCQTNKISLTVSFFKEGVSFVISEDNTIYKSITYDWTTDVFRKRHNVNNSCPYKNVKSVFLVDSRIPQKMGGILAKVDELMGHVANG